VSGEFTNRFGFFVVADKGDMTHPPCLPVHDGTGTGGLALVHVRTGTGGHHDKII
jgi:hypothetical protein